MFSVLNSNSLQYPNNLSYTIGLSYLQIVSTSSLRTFSTSSCLFTDSDNESSSSVSTTLTEKKEEIERYEAIGEELTRKEIKEIIEKYDNEEVLSKEEKDTIDYIKEHMLDQYNENKSFKENVIKELEQNYDRIEELEEEIRVGDKRKLE